MQLGQVNELEADEAEVSERPLVNSIQLTIKLSASQVLAILPRLRLLDVNPASDLTGAS